MWLDYCSSTFSSIKMQPHCNTSLTILEIYTLCSMKLISVLQELIPEVMICINETLLIIVHDKQYFVCIISVFWWLVIFGCVWSTSIAMLGFRRSKSDPWHVREIPSTEFLISTSKMYSGLFGCHLQDEPMVVNTHIYMGYFSSMVDF